MSRTGRPPDRMVHPPSGVRGPRIPVTPSQATVRVPTPRATVRPWSSSASHRTAAHARFDGTYEYGKLVLRIDNNPIYIVPKSVTIKGAPCKEGKGKNRYRGLKRRALLDRQRVERHVASARVEVAFL